MKNILIINPFFGQIGPNSFLIEFVNANINIGNTITVLYPEEDNISKRLEVIGAKVIILPLIKIKHINNHFLKLFIRFITELRITIYVISNIPLKQYSYCISNTELYSFSLFFISKYSKVVIIVHSLSFVKYRWLNKFIFKIQSSTVNKYIAVSRKVKNELIKKGVVKPIDILYNTVDLNKFRFNKNYINSSKINVLSIIHPVPHKGAHHLIKIIYELIKRNKNVHFTILGWNSISNDHIYKKQIENQIKILDLSTYISLKGNVSDVLEYYKNSNIFIHPSESESFGIVIAEAMAMKLPVISFDVGAISEIVQNNKTGYLIKPFDITSFVIKLEKIIIDKRLRDNFGEKGFLIVQTNFNSNNLSKNINKILN